MCIYPACIKLITISGSLGLNLLSGELGRYPEIFSISINTDRCVREKYISSKNTFCPLCCSKNSIYIVILERNINIAIVIQFYFFDF